MYKEDKWICECFPSLEGSRIASMALCQLQDWAKGSEVGAKPQTKLIHSRERQWKVQTKQGGFCREAVTQSCCCGPPNIKWYVDPRSSPPHLRLLPPHTPCDVCISPALTRSRSPTAWEFQSDIITMMKTDPINTEHYDEYNSDYGGSHN